jgi:hypothetical protein
MVGTLFGDTASFQRSSWEAQHSPCGKITLRHTKREGVHFAECISRLLGPRNGCRYAQSLPSRYCRRHPVDHRPGTEQSSQQGPVDVRVLPSGVDSELKGRGDIWNWFRSLVQRGKCCFDATTTRIGKKSTVPSPIKGKVCDSRGKKSQVREAKG